jgi:hypothetical protein
MVRMLLKYESFSNEYPVEEYVENTKLNGESERIKGLLWV